MTSAPRAYVAGPLFDEGERWWIEQVDALVAEAGFITFLPHRDNPPKDEHNVRAIFENDKRGIDDVESSYIDDGVNPAMGLSSIDLRRYQYHRVRHGYGLDLGYQPDAHNSFYLRAVDAGYTEAKQDSHLNISLNGSPTAVSRKPHMAATRCSPAIKPASGGKMILPAPR